MARAGGGQPQAALRSIMAAISPTSSISKPVSAAQAKAAGLRGSAVGGPGIDSQAASGRDSNPQKLVFRRPAGPNYRCLCPRKSSPTAPSSS
jgi:hypothetical protein